MESQTKTILTIVVLAALALAGAMYVRNARMVDDVVSPTDDQTVCTMDAFQCPDGSYVGRTGPNCEFVCPQ